MSNINTLRRNQRLRKALATLSDDDLAIVLEVAESGDVLQIEGSARFVLHGRGIKANLAARALREATDDDMDPLQTVGL